MSKTIWKWKELNTCFFFSQSESKLGPQPATVAAKKISRIYFVLYLGKQELILSIYRNILCIIININCNNIKVSNPQQNPVLSSHFILPIRAAVRKNWQLPDYNVIFRFSQKCPMAIPLPSPCPFSLPLVTRLGLAILNWVELLGNAIKPVGDFSGGPRRGKGESMIGL